MGILRRGEKDIRKQEGKIQGWKVALTKMCFFKALVRENCLRQYGHFQCFVYTRHDEP